MGDSWSCVETKYPNVTPRRPGYVLTLAVAWKLRRAGKEGAILILAAIALNHGCSEEELVKPTLSVAPAVF